MLHGCQIQTDTTLPPFGVAQSLALDSVGSVPDLFRFWLVSHAYPLAARFWRTAVLRECLPDPTSDLNFEALAPLTRHGHRTMLIRTAMPESV